MTRIFMRLTRRGFSVRVAAFLLPALLFAEQLALGADSAFLAALAALGEIALALLLLLILEPDARFWPKAAPILCIIALILAWLIQPTLFPTLFPSRTTGQFAPDLAMPGLVRVLGGCSLLLAAAWLGYRHGGLRLAIDWIMAFQVMALLIALVMRQIDPEHIWGYDRGIQGLRFSGTLLNSNASACLSGVLALLATGRLLSALQEKNAVAPSRIEIAAPYFSALAILIGVGACAISQSRTALGITLVLMLVLVASDKAFWSRFSGQTGLVAIGVILLVAVVIIALFGDSTIDRLSKLGHDAAERRMIWIHYWELGRQHLWGGYGLLSFDSVNVSGLSTTRDAADFWYINAPHNIALSLLIAGGLPYVGLMLWATSAMLAQIWTGSDHRRSDMLLRSIVAALILILGCGWYDIALDVPAVISLAIVLIALPWGRALRRSADTQSAAMASA